MSLTNIILDFITEHWIEIIGIIGMLGFPFSIYTYVKTKKNKKPTYIVRTIKLIEPRIKQLNNAINILYQDNKIENLSISKIALWNEGKDTIDNTDIAKSNMKMYTPAVVTGETVSIHLRHGIQPQHRSYLYIVLPASKRDSVSSFDIKNVRVVQNDDIAQIVYLPRTECYWAAIYHPGKMVIEGEPFVANLSGIYKLTKSVGKLKIEQKRAF